MPSGFSKTIAISEFIGTFAHCFLWIQPVLEMIIWPKSSQIPNEKIH